MGAYFSAEGSLPNAALVRDVISEGGRRGTRGVKVNIYDREENVGARLPHFA